MGDESCLNLVDEWTTSLIVVGDISATAQASKCKLPILVLGGKNLSSMVDVLREASFSQDEVFYFYSTFGFGSKRPTPKAVVFDIGGVLLYGSAKGLHDSLCFEFK